MRPQRTTTPLLVWVVLLGLAAVLHLPFLAWLDQHASQSTSANTKRLRTTSRAYVVPKPKKPPETQPPKGQIVTLPEPEIEQEPPKETKFLSQHNTRVKEEMKASPKHRSAKRRLGAPAPERSKVQSKLSRSIKKTTRPKTEKQRQLAAATKAEPKTEKGELHKRTEIFRSNRAKALLPSVDTESTLANLQTLTGASASDDALLTVKKEGPETLLNSRKFQHWSYFDRIKRRVRRHWDPRMAHRRADPSGKIYGVKDRLTVLRVTLDDDGMVQGMSTVKNSGMTPLDKEALRAMNKAGPFPNPPNGLIDDKGTIVFQFGFLFEITTSQFKFFRMKR